jgi:hypothetical protein
MTGKIHLFKATDGALCYTQNEDKVTAHFLSIAS